MKKRSKHYKMRPRFPDVELMLGGIFVMMLGVALYQIYYYKDLDFIWFLPVSLLGLISIYFMTNHRNKVVVIDESRIKIKPYLKSTYREYDIKDIRGYDLKENYTHSGLDYFVRIITVDDKKITLNDEVYPEYQKLPLYLKSVGIKCLGKTDFKWKYKHIYSRIGVIAFPIGILLFLLMNFLKLVK